jgi:hypothetical protein
MERTRGPQGERFRNLLVAKQVLRGAKAKNEAPLMKP